MARNKGYWQCRRTAEADEMYTPYYAVQPLLKYVKKTDTIWCPFDMEWSAYYRTFLENGYNVIRSHIDEGGDFFSYEPDNYDVIISNPPFLIKDAILERLYELDKPFAMLYPLPSLQGKSRCQLFIKGGVQLLLFDERIGYHKMDSMDKTVNETPFASVYLCRNFLPNDFIVEHLEKYQKGLLLENVCSTQAGNLAYQG